MHIPVGGVACLMLEPGVRVSHSACALAARVGTLLVWIGKGASGSIHRGSRVVHVPIVCCIRRN
jgi:hypothetical protein